MRRTSGRKFSKPQKDRGPRRSFVSFQLSSLILSLPSASHTYAIACVWLLALDRRLLAVPFPRLLRLSFKLLSGNIDMKMMTTTQRNLITRTMRVIEVVEGRRVQEEAQLSVRIAFLYEPVFQLIVVRSSDMTVEYDHLRSRFTAVRCSGRCRLLLE